MSLLFLYNGVMKATGPTTYSVSSEWWMGAQELIQMHTYLMSIDVQNVQVLGRR